MVEISHRQHALFLFSSSTSCHHRHVFFGSFQCEENLDSTLCGSFSGNDRMKSLMNFFYRLTTLTLNLQENQTQKLADACRPTPDRALRQGRIESCTYRPAAWFVFEFYHVTGRCFIHSDGQVSWTRELRLSASSALRSSPLAFLLSGLLTTLQHSSGLIVCCLDFNNPLYIEQPRPGRRGLWHCCSNDQH